MSFWRNKIVERKIDISIGIGTGIGIGAGVLSCVLLRCS